jgi:GT2 family glycosyltransferase
MDTVPALFAASLANLAVALPAGSRVSFYVKGPGIGPKRDAFVQHQLLPSSHLEWLLFVDSDQRVPADAVHRLLAYDVAIVGGLVMKTDGSSSCVKSLDPAAREFVQGGLQEVAEIGTGCLLIRREVFAAIPGPPWFPPNTSGPGAGVGEDSNFCELARKAGFKIHCDTDLEVGHFINLAMTPDLARIIRDAPDALTLSDGRPHKGLAGLGAGIR